MDFRILYSPFFTAFVVRPSILTSISSWISFHQTKAVLAFFPVSPDFHMSRFCTLIGCFRTLVNGQTIGKRLQYFAEAHLFLSLGFSSQLQVKIKRGNGNPLLIRIMVDHLHAYSIFTGALFLSHDTGLLRRTFFFFYDPAHVMEFMNSLICSSATDINHL